MEQKNKYVMIEPTVFEEFFCDSINVSPTPLVRIDILYKSGVNKQYFMRGELFDVLELWKKAKKKIFIVGNFEESSVSYIDKKEVTSVDFTIVNEVN